MNKILEAHYIKNYPKIFRDMYGDKTKTCMAWGCSCGDGWFFLLDTLCKRIQKHIDRRAELIAKGYAQEDEKDPIPQVVFAQVKEKFGALRIYYDGGDDYISAMVCMVEDLSHDICENCGQFNEEVGRVEKGWIQSLCPSCCKEYGKKIVQRKEIIALWRKVRKSRKNPIRSWQGIDELTPVKKTKKEKK